MKENRRISFDVPVEIHTILKIGCAQDHIALRDLMRENAIKIAEEYKKKYLHAVLLQGFQEANEGKVKELTDEDLEKWEKIANEP